MNKLLFLFFLFWNGVAQAGSHLVSCELVTAHPLQQKSLELKAEILGLHDSKHVTERVLELHRLQTQLAAEWNLRQGDDPYFFFPLQPRYVAHSSSRRNRGAVLTKAQREKFRVRVEGGLLMDPDGNPLDTAGRFWQVVLAWDGLFVAPEASVPGQGKRKVKHSSLGQDLPVAFAGMGRISQGFPEKTTHGSGRYLTHWLFLPQIQRYFLEKNVSYPSLELVSLWPEGDWLSPEQGEFLRSIGFPLTDDHNAYFAKGTEMLESALDVLNRAGEQTAGKDELVQAQDFLAEYGDLGFQKHQATGSVLALLKNPGLPVEIKAEFIRWLPKNRSVLGDSTVIAQLKKMAEGPGTDVLLHEAIAVFFRRWNRPFF